MLRINLQLKIKIRQMYLVPLITVQTKNKNLGILVHKLIIIYVQLYIL
jgi:hypothetical protein